MAQRSKTSKWGTDELAHKGTDELAIEGTAEGAPDMAHPPTICFFVLNGLDSTGCGSKSKS